MHPDRRRAGRAIRKQQREAREQLKQWEEFAAAVRWFGEALHDAAQKMMVAFGPIVEHFSRARGYYWTTLERQQLAPTPGATAAEPAEAGTGDPSQTGVASLSEAHSAFRGITPGESIYDEPWAFDDEEDRR